MTRVADNVEEREVRRAEAAEEAASVDVIDAMATDDALAEAASLTVGENIDIAHME